MPIKLRRIRLPAGFSAAIRGLFSSPQIRMLTAGKIRGIRGEENKPWITAEKSAGQRIYMRFFSNLLSSFE